MVLPLEPTVWSSRKSDSWCCWLVALASIVMKVFERLLKNHICSSIPVTLDPLQFAYRPNRSTDDAISQVLHSSLTHIDSKNVNYVRLLFIDYSSAFNTIVPIKLAVKLTDLGLNSSLCDWIKDFLTGRPQVNEWMNEWMNDAFIWRFHCVLLYTQSDLQSCVGGGGGSLLNHHQCAASTWMMRRLPQDNGASALTTHTSYRWRGERVIEPIKWMGIIRRSWLTKASGGNLARTPGLYPYSLREVPWNF